MYDDPSEKIFNLLIKYKLHGCKLNPNLVIKAKNGKQYTGIELYAWRSTKCVTIGFDGLERYADKDGWGSPNLIPKFDELTIESQEDIINEVKSIIINEIENI